MGQQVQREQTAQNALADLAPAAIAGDQNALAQLAQYAPEMALDIRDRTDRRRVRQEGLDLDRQRVGIAQARLTAEQEAETRTLAEAQSEQERKATVDALTAMQRGYSEGNRSIFDTGLVALRRIDPDTPDHVTFDNFADMAPRLDGMVEVYTSIDPPKTSAAEAEIARLMETGLDRNTAINIRDGVWVTSQNAQTGEVQIIDKATGQPVAQPEFSEAPTGARQPAPQGSTDAFGKPFSKSNTAFGLGGAIRGTVNAAGDTLGFGQAFPETADTQRDFSVLRETLVNDLAGGYDRQPPSWLLKQIQELTPQAGSPFQGPAGAQDKLAALGRSVGAELQDIEKQLRNRRLRPALKQQLEGRAASLQKVLGRVTQAHRSFQGGGVQLSPDIQERMRAYE
ncbi:MAG: hypothetical protein NXH97_18235 [Rhodobacteraceae bacterium]|nr:hypothetical protein [Paracoccaceae bacterium]